MKAAIKDLWVRALRGGKFEQTTGLLRNSRNECCCLGVLCDIVDPSGWNETAFGRNAYCGDTKRLSSYLLNKFGLTEEQQSALIDLNDSGNSFKKIAKYIEKNI